MPDSSECSTRRTRTEISREMPSSLYRYIWRISGRAQIRLTVVSTIVFLLAMVPLELQRRIVNGAIEAVDIQSLLVLGGAYFAVVLLQGFLKYSMNMQRGRISESAVRDFRNRIFEVTTTPRENGDDREVEEGAVVAMVSAEVEPLGGFVGQSISLPLVQLGSLVTIFGYLLWVQPLIASVAIALFLPQLFFVPRLQRAINKLSKTRIEILRDVGDLIVDTGNAEPTGEKPNRDRFEQLAQRVFNLRIRIFHLKYLLKFLINMLNHLGALSVLGIGGWLVIEGETEVGTIVAFLSGLQRVVEPGRELVRFLRQLSDSRVKYNLVREALF